MTARTGIAKPVPDGLLPAAEHEPETRGACLAVLPFENLSSRKGQDYFSTGLVDDLITDLSHFPGLQVMAPYTSRILSGASRDEREAARDLKINFLLKGNLRRKAGQVRISAQLIEVERGAILWAERYDAAMDMIFEIQDDIIARVVSAISARIDKILLAAARNKSVTRLAAYDCWLRGMDLMRQGTPEADREARKIFKQALTIDPNYGRAYAGLSLSHFNDWSCQLWDQWEINERKAFDYASKAFQLDDTDYVVHWILGRILLYRRQFDVAEQHVDRSLALNANDADSLIQIATAKALLGKGAEGEGLYQKALRLNPFRETWYHTCGALTYFVQRKYRTCIETALKGPLTEVWVDTPGFLAAACAHEGDHERARQHLDLFIESFKQKISAGRTPRPGEIVAWITLANPFRHESDARQLVRGLILAGLDDPEKDLPPAPDRDPEPASGPVNLFRKERQMWRISFGGMSIQLPDLKGFGDLARLLASPGTEIHCMDLMDSAISGGDPEPVIDAKARRSYEARLRQLREEMEEARANNDLVRAETLGAELDQLTDHLSKSLGLGKRTRKVDPTAERARTAVTWRIRSAIRKIEEHHPGLGRHLAHSVRTGGFCSYIPEKPCVWQW